MVRITSRALVLGCLLMGAAHAAAADRAAALTPSTREVHYTSRSVVQVNARLRFTTLIILPDTEQILDFVCGDKDFWIVSGAQNLAYVKPAKAGAVTNLNLVTASGNVYSFLLIEGTDEPDLKLYVTPDDSMSTAVSGTKRFYTADEVNELKQAAEDARKAAETARADVTRLVDERVNQFRSAYPTQLQFPYRFKAQAAPFNVTAMYTDGRFTYIRAEASELPSLYELRDGAPNLVNFQVEHGVYIVPKVLTNGYLAIGKRRLPFETAK